MDDIKVGDKFWSIFADYKNNKPFYVIKIIIKETSYLGDKSLCRFKTDFGYYPTNKKYLFNSSKECQKEVDKKNEEYLKKVENRKKIDKLLKLNEKNYIKDGIYNVSGIEFFVLEEDDDTGEKSIEWVERHTVFYIANAYETRTTILFAEKPLPFNGKKLGGGFHYGSTNLLLDCPKSILILAEND